MKLKRLVAGVFAVSIMSMVSIVSTAAATEINSGDLKCVVEENSESLEYLRFALKEKTEDNNLLYNNFFSGFTTVYVEDTAYVYGTGSNSDAPSDNADNEHISVQNFGNIQVRQELSFDKGLSDEYGDTLKISYTLTNYGNDAKAGLRIMLDPMIGDNDSCYPVGGKHETCIDSNIPDVLEFESEQSGNMGVYVKVSDENIPDKIIFAEWKNLYDNRWNYDVDNKKEIEDSALAFLWKERTLKSGETVTYTVNYGLQIKEENNDNSEIINSKYVSSDNSEKNNTVISNVKTDEKSVSSIALSESSATVSESTNENSLNNIVSDNNAVSTGYAFPAAVFIAAAVSCFAVLMLKGRGERNEK